MDESVEHEFTAFVAGRVHALLRVAYALTGDQHAAEDLVQGALAKAFARSASIRGSAEPYVRRIIYHDHVSTWRRTRRREVTVAELPEQPDGRRIDGDASLRLLVRDALRALPPRQRAVLVLRYLDDLSVEQTADLLGLRVGTVASQTSRALARMRRLLPAVEWEREPSEVLR